MTNSYRMFRIIIIIIMLQPVHQWFPLHGLCLLWSKPLKSYELRHGMQYDSSWCRHHFESYTALVTTPQPAVGGDPRVHAPALTASGEPPMG
jgi:hypothetical protein